MAATAPPPSTVHSYRSWPLPIRCPVGNHQQPCTPTCSAARVSAELPPEDARTRRAADVLSAVASSRAVMRRSLDATCWSMVATRSSSTWCKCQS